MIALLGALVLVGVPRAVRQRRVGFVLLAFVVVGRAAVEPARPLEDVGHVGRAERGRVVGAQQQGIERPELESQLVGGFAVGPGIHVLVMVVTTGDVCGQHAENRQTHLYRRGIIVTLAVAGRTGV